MSDKKSRGVIGGMIGNVLESYKDQFVAILRRELDSAVRREIAPIVRAEAQRVIDAMHEMDWNQYHSVLHASHSVALRESAEFALQHMPKVRIFPHPHDTLRHALSLAPTGGLSLEFGVFTGTTLRIIAETRKGHGAVYGFDSFKGLPEDWRSGIPKGTFAVKELPKVEGAELVVGWFNETLPGFLASHDGVVDFLHVDCDIYSSTKTILDLVGSRLRAGSIVLFDEFFNYPDWQLHEYKAWNEFLARTGMRCTYEGYTSSHEQVIVRIVA